MNPNRNDVKKFGTYYKLRHIPSGLFYVPSSFKTLTNLDKFGKLYTHVPEDLREGKYSHFYDENNIKRIVHLEDWEVVIVQILEAGTLNYKYEINRIHNDNINQARSIRLRLENESDL